MRRAIAAIVLIAALWTSALVAFILIDVRGYAPNTGYVVLLVGLWLMALVVYGALLNPEGRFIRYVVFAALSLAAASVLVGVLRAFLNPMHTLVPPG